MFSSEFRSVPGYEGIYKLSPYGGLLSCERQIVDSLGRKRTLKAKMVKAQNDGLGYYLHKDGESQSVSISTLLFQTFPELRNKVESIEGEVWKAAPMSPKYEVSDLGRVKRLEGVWFNGHGSAPLPEMLLSPTKNSDGYLSVNLNIDGSQLSIRVNRLVAWTFIGDPGEFDVDHKDFSRDNNELSNLRIMSHKDNVEHSRANGRYAGNKRGGI